MKEKLIELLACPTCKNYPLKLRISEQKKGEIKSGELECAKCGKAYPLSDGIPYMIPSGLSEDWRKKQDRYIEDKKNWRSLRKIQKIQKSHEHYRRDQQHFFQFVQPKGGKLLDIGCGDAQKGDFLPTTEYYGIDPFVENLQPYILSTLKLTYTYPFVVAVGEYLPFRSELFDYVVIMATLDHVSDPQKVISESYRVLKPSGLLCISVSIKEKSNKFKSALRIVCDKGVIYFFNYFFKSYIPAEIGGGTHMRTYTEELLISEFNPKLFEIVDKEYYGSSIFLKVRKRVK